MKVAENCVKQESKVRFPLELTQTPVYCLPKNVNTNPRFTNLQSSSPSCRSVPKGKTKNGGGAISDWSPVVEPGGWRRAMPCDLYQSSLAWAVQGWSPAP